jgi:acyl carrier protein
MVEEQIEQKMIDIFRSVFAELANADMQEIKKASRMEIGTWDSTNHLMLILCIEEEYKCHIADDVAGSMQSFHDALNAVGPPVQE